MNRRTLLATISAAGTGAVAGCGALSSDDDEESQERIEELEADLESRNETVTQLEDERDDLKQEVSELEEQLDQQKEEYEQQLSELNSQIDDAEEEVAALEQQRTALIVDRMESLYETADSLYSLGETEFSEAATALRNDQDTRALNLFRGAFGRYDAVTGYTFEIRELADREGYTETKEIARASNQYASDMENACDDYAVAAQHFILGNIEEGNARISDGDQDVSQADRHRFASLTEFRNSMPETEDSDA